MLPSPSEPSPESRRQPAPVRPPMPGDVVGERFALEYVLGRGAMGEVWAASHRLLGVPCAIKFLSVDPRFDTLDFDERFEIEARTTARLSTKTRHIVRVTDYGHHEGRPFLVMERLEGETLEERVDREGPLEPALALTVAEQIANALRVAHAEKLVHRDLKSANVFLARDEQGLPVAKVLDFGLVRVLEAAEPASRTSIGLIVGSPHSMSPEQAAGKPIDARSDVWALATVVYEMLTGESAFEGAQVLELVSNVVRCAYVPIAARAPHHAPFSAVFERAFSANIDDRYPTVDELVADLRRVVDADRAASTSSAPPPEVVIDPAELSAVAAAFSESASRMPAFVDAPWGASPEPRCARSSLLEVTRVSVPDGVPVARRRRVLPALLVLAGALAIVVAAAREAGLAARAYAATQALVEQAAPPMKAAPVVDPAAMAPSGPVAGAPASPPAPALPSSSVAVRPPPVVPPRPVAPRAAPRPVPAVKIAPGTSSSAPAEAPPSDSASAAPAVVPAPGDAPPPAPEVPPSALPSPLPGAPSTPDPASVM